MEENEWAILAGGCFWCTEAIFTRLKGVKAVTPGYAGGEVDNPTYEQVSSGTTGHAESIKIQFNPKEISYEKILEIFMATHDPTSFNRQGNDIGTQYRSVIFYEDDAQKQIAEKLIQKLTKEKKYQKPIVTKIEPYKNFFPAEDYHKNYYDQNKGAPYCNIIIDPKIQKLIREYSSEVKDEYLKSHDGS